METREILSVANGAKDDAPTLEVMQRDTRPLVSVLKMDQAINASNILHQLWVGWAHLGEILGGTWSVSQKLSFRVSEPGLPSDG